jgi:RNA polymerase sigma factor (sigma-70 family)
MPPGALSDIIGHIRRLALRADVAGLEDRLLLERFLKEHDEEAFQMLVRRHGPMIFAVCRRFLANLQDAEDAFQATLLVLVRKAGSIGRRDLLANWLHGVACRTALRSRADSARRRAREGQAAEAGTKQGERDTPWSDLRSVLDEELGRLPTKYRLPVILCYLEGLTFAEAARQLGWPAGTVSGRLARARELLRQRLTRRGITLTATGLSAALAESGQAAVPALLLGSTVRAAAEMAAKHAVAGAAISAPVALLTEGVLKAMFLTKLKIATALVAVILAGAGAGASLYPTLMAQAPVPQPAEVNLPAPQLPGPKGPPIKELPIRDYITQENDGLPDLNETTLKKLLSSSKTPAKMKNLLEAQFETAAGVAHARWLEFRAGRGTLAFVLEAFRHLTDAERDLSDRKADHIAALERQLSRLREVEKINQERFEGGRIPIQDLWEPRYHRVQTELALERLKSQ